MDERGESRAPRFAYERGELEIMSPSTEHESAAYFWGCSSPCSPARRARTHTVSEREDLEHGFGPDACFYVHNEERIRGKPRIDLDVDPPPDLVIEVDITGPSLDRLSVYARIGISEVWRHDGDRVSIFVLGGGEYAVAAESAILPPLSGQVLSRFLDESGTRGSAAWMREVREWARNRAQPSN